MRRNSLLARWLLTVLLLAGLLFGAVGRSLARVGATALRTIVSPGDVVISEFRTRGSAGASDEFIELYNKTSSPIDLGNWRIKRSSGCGLTTTNIATIPVDTILEPGQYFLIGGSAYNDSVSPDFIPTSLNIADNGGIALFTSDGVTIIDQVGMCSGTFFLEGTPLIQLTTNVDRGYERKDGGAVNSCIDTGDNLSDFTLKDPTDPQNASYLPLTLCGNTPPTATATSSPTNTLPPTDTSTPTFTPTVTSPLSLVINEIGWSGTKYASGDEWIELYNPNPFAVNMNGWHLITDDGNLDINLSGNTITPGDYFLIGRYSNIFSDVAVDLAFSSSIGKWSSLSNNGTVLRLYDPTGAPVDSANSASLDGDWLAGSASPNYASMERIGPVLPDGLFSWATFADTTFVAHDRATPTPNPIWGTPGQANWTAATVTVTPSPSNTPTKTATPTKTVSPTSTLTPTSVALRSVIINEVGWMGTAASSSDEWIELYNRTNNPILLDGWSLRAVDGEPNIALSGTIPAHGFFLLERVDDDSIKGKTADLVYSGEMGNSGETLRLLDHGNVVDTANENGGSWPAGSLSIYGSMERSSVNVQDKDANWFTHPDGANPRCGHDANWDGVTNNANRINGTPKCTNWANNVTATATPTNTLVPSHTPTFTDTPAKTITITEVGWMGTQASSSDEWIELYNHTNKSINLIGWRIRAADGSPDFVIENCQSGNSSCEIKPKGFFLLERTDDTVVNNIPADMIYGGEMSNLGEALSLYDPLHNLVDTANGNGGAWPGGSSSTMGSMERRQPTATDLDSAWFTHSGGNPHNGKDAAGNDIKGTPKKSNWSFTVTATATPTNTPTATGTLPPTQVPFKTVVISEVAWAGTNSSSYDEWIELYNMTSKPVDLEGWRLVSFRWDGTKFVLNLNIALEGTIPPRTSQSQGDTSGYFLLETRESAISNITADQLYSGTLYNTGEILLLCSKYNVDIAKNCTVNTKNQLVDFINGSLTSDGKARPWPAGSSSTYGSMERRDVRSDEPTTYFTHTGASPRFGQDANGNNIKGTPKHPNWAFTVTATPYATYTPTRTPTPRPQAAPILVINEVLARAGTDWNLDGVVDVYDEFIEVINAGTVNVSLSGYKLADSSSNTFSLPSQTLEPGEKALFYSKQSGIRLEDSGDTIRLIRTSSNSTVDEIAYPVIRSVDASICRYTDGYGSWIYGCYPTPGLPNSLSGKVPLGPASVCFMPDSTPLEFVQAECEEFGYGIWNPDYWDSFPGEGDEVWRSDPLDKAIIYYE